MASEKTAAADGRVGELRRDPFAMLPFCGYNMGDYFAHWLSVGAMTDPARLPRIYHVNWFRKNPAGQFAWPGYGDNSRVLKWICQRLSGQAAAVPTPIGSLPAAGALDTSGLAVSDDDLRLLLSVDPGTWQDEAGLIGEHLATFGRAAARAAVGGTRRLAGAPEGRPLTARPGRPGAGAGTRTVRRDATVKRTLVEEVMTAPVVTAEETMPVRHLMALLYASGIGAVPVTDPEAGCWAWCRTPTSS